MPTKKQRRRRDKGKRHEYEYVIVDESGEEVPVDPAELRAAREKDRPASSSKGRQPAVARDRKGRPLREPRKPTWQRAAKMGAFFVIALFLFTSLTGGKKKPSLVTRIVISGGYAVIGIPFFYWMDRTAYRRWEKATGRTQAPKKPAS